MPRKIVQEKLLQLLAEDIGQGDVTTAAVIPPKLVVEATVIAKEQGIIAGIEEATILAESLGLKATAEVVDGEEIKKGQTLLKIVGDAQTILTAERTMLNLLSRMSGIATTTWKITKKLKDARLQTKIAATRKTALGLLYFDKKAVQIGNGDPHRLHLDDMILIKDNHIVIAGSIENAVKAAKQNASFTKKIEAETTNTEEVLAAAKAGADIIMLDNFTPDQITHAIALLENNGFADKVLLEASGGINQENLLDYASTKVDILSLGELTHSVKALDLSLEITSISKKEKE